MPFSKNHPKSTMRIWLAFLNGSKIIENLENGYSLTIYSAQFTTQNNVFLFLPWEYKAGSGAFLEGTRNTPSSALYSLGTWCGTLRPPHPPRSMLLVCCSEVRRLLREADIQHWAGGGGGWGECLAVIRGYFCMPAWGTLTLAVVLEATCVLFLARLPEGTPGSGHCWRELSI